MQLCHLTTKSWSAWFDSVLYHADYYFVCQDFIQEEVNRAPNTASNSLLQLEEMYKDPSFMKKLHAELAFLKEKVPTLLEYLNYFQERMPHVTQAHVKMESLLDYLDVNTKLEERDLGFCFEGNFTFSCQEKKELMSLFTSAFTSAHAKLYKYVVDGAQPASKFLDQIRVLDPRNLIDTEKNFDSIDNIPGFETVSRTEWELYVNKLGPLAVKNSKDGKVDLKLFWKSKASDLPQLYKLGSCYCTTTIGLYDVERAFSGYSEILDEKRRSLDESTIKAFHFLNWNLQLKCAIQQEKEQEEPVIKPETANNSDKVFTKEKQVPVETKEIPRLWKMKQNEKGKVASHSNSTNEQERGSNGSKSRACYLCHKDMAYSQTCNTCAHLGHVM